jgi:uncharacterized protein (TIRG00374 family)
LGKFAVSATLLGLLVRRISWAELRGELQQTHVPALIVPFAIILISNVLGAAQWHWILRAAGVGSGFWRVLRAYTIGLFLNNFMLGTVGGDVYKIYTLGRSGEMRRVAGATIVDRVIAMSALCTLGLVAALAELRSDRLPVEQTLFIIAFVLLLMGTAAVLLHPRYGEALVRRLAALPLGRFGARLARLVDHLRDYRQQPRLLNRMFLLSLVIQGSRVVAHFCVGLAMGWPLHAADLGKFFVVIPILGLIIALPISIGGWGVREWAGMALFGPLGHGGEEAVSLLALTAMLTLVASLAGAVALLLGAAPRRTAIA